MRLMSDVPLGAMLSGGLDSSLIVALMARNMTEPVKTFSVGFAEDREGNELADARLVAERLRGRAPRAGALLPRRRPSTSPTSSGTSTSRWPTSPRSASSRSASSPAARHGRPVGPGRRRAPGRVPQAQGGRARGGVAPAAGPAPVRRERLVPLAPARLRRAARTLAAPGPRRPPARMSGQFDARLRRRSPAARWRLDGGAAHRARRARLDGLPDEPLAGGPATSTRSSASSTTCSTTSTAPRWPTPWRCASRSWTTRWWSSARRSPPA